jgi:hypothetical protein
MLTPLCAVCAGPLSAPVRSDHIVCDRKDRNGFCRLLGGAKGQIPDSCYGIDACFA